MSKKLLKRPTFLEDNAHPSLINDFQQEMIRKRAALFIPALEIPYFFLDLKLFNVWNACVQKKVCHFWWLNTVNHWKPLFKFTLDAKQMQFCNQDYIQSLWSTLLFPCSLQYVNVKITIWQQSSIAGEFFLFRFKTKNLQLYYHSYPLAFYHDYLGMVLYYTRTLTGH